MEKEWVIMTLIPLQSHPKWPRLKSGPLCMLCTHMYGALGSRRFAAAAGCWDLPSRHVDGHSKHSTSTSHLL